MIPRVVVVVVALVCSASCVSGREDHRFRLLDEIGAGSDRYDQYLARVDDDATYASVAATLEPLGCVVSSLVPRNTLVVVCGARVVQRLARVTETTRFRILRPLDARDKTRDDPAWNVTDGLRRATFEIALPPLWTFETTDDGGADPPTDPVSFARAVVRRLNEPNGTNGAAAAYSTLASGVGDLTATARVASRDKVFVEVSPSRASAAMAWASKLRVALRVEPRYVASISNGEAIVVLQTGGEGAVVASESEATPLWNAGISGEGQIVGVGDTGADRRNCFLSGESKFVMYRSVVNDADGTPNDTDEQGHGTHVVGSIAGSTTTTTRDDHDGIARRARIAFTDMSGSEGGLVTTSDMGDGYYAHARDVGARVHSDSWGYSTTTYPTASRETDEFAWNHKTFLPLFAVGNSGLDDVHGLETFKAPSNAKNALAVGVTMSPRSVDRIEHWDGVYRPWEVVVSGRDARHWTHLKMRGVNGDALLSSASTHALAATRVVEASPSNACSAVTNTGDVAGAIAVVRRGGCTFGTKARFAVDAGAVAVVVVNHEVETGFMKMRGDTTANTVNVPVVFVTKKDGELLLGLHRQNNATFAIAGPLARVDSKIEYLAKWSSGGPTMDGRYVPHVVAPGDAILSASTLTNAEFDAGDTCALSYKSGSSMATPLTAGAVALVRQYFVDGFYPTGTRVASDGFEPTSALVRAVLVNGARPLEGFETDGKPLETAPSNRQGHGRVDLSQSVPLSPQNDDGTPPRLRLVVFDESEASSDATTMMSPFTLTGQTRSACVRVSTTDHPLRATLAWTDPAASAVGEGSLINDLDLVVTHEGRIVHPVPGTEDRKNTVEKFAWSAPEPGNYHVEVRAHDLQFNWQPFALVVSGDVRVVEGFVGDAFACRTML